MVPGMAKGHGIKREQERDGPNQGVLNLADPATVLRQGFSNTTGVEIPGRWKMPSEPLSQETCHLDRM